MTESSDELAAFARTLIDEGRRDRDVLRQRWQMPRWRDDVLRIATTLERNPALIPAVEACIAVGTGVSPVPAARTNVQP